MLIIHLYCHDFAIINIIVLLDIQQTAAAVPHLSNVMTIHGSTYVRKNGKAVFFVGEGWLRLSSCRNGRTLTKL